MSKNKVKNQVRLKIPICIFTENLCYLFTDKETTRARLMNSFIERYKKSFISELNHFFECIHSGEMPIVGPRDILSAVQVAIAGQKSLEKNQPQKVIR